MQKNKPKERFIDYVLFNPQSFNILAGMSYAFALIFCLGITCIGLFFRIYTLVAVFGLFTIVAIRNLYKNRNVFKAFKRNKKDYLDLTVADTLNNVFNAKDEDKESKIEDECSIIADDYIINENKEDEE